VKLDCCKLCHASRWRGDKYNWEKKGKAKEKKIAKNITTLPINAKDAT